jgi:hypothetical protein
MPRNIIGRRFAGVLLTLGGFFISPAWPAARAAFIFGNSVSADGLGNVYISGRTSADAIVAKYNSAGRFQWTRRLGTPQFDHGHAVSADGLGHVYISGETFGSLGGPNAGGFDAFASQYDAAGSLQWTRQVGTPEYEVSLGVSADGLGNVFISGRTDGSLGGPSAGSVDAFVSQYDAAGNLRWTKQLGTPYGDYSYGVSADGLGNVHISGSTTGSLGGPYAGGGDAFVSKFDAAGNVQWTRQQGTSDYDVSLGVSADGLGNVYISGYTRGSLGSPNAGGNDVFVSKYDAAGNLQWTRQLGTSTDDRSRSVSVDGLGNVYISGDTRGSLGGPNAGGSDAFVSKYDAAGSLQWIRQLGTARYELGDSVSADNLGNVYISAHIDISGETFISKLDAAGSLLWTKSLNIPEPASWLLAALGAAAVLRRPTRRSLTRE